MKKTSILTCFLAGLALLAGCIHQYPEVRSNKSVTLTFEVQTDTSLPLYSSASRSANEIAGLRRRFIIDAYLDGKAIMEKRILTTRAIELEAGRYSIPASMELDERAYTFAVWCDYVADAGGKDLHFHTADLTNVQLTEAYHSDHTQREAFCGMAMADLSSCQDRPDAQAHLCIDLKRPQAKFVLMSTDTEEFIDLIRAAGGDFLPDSYRVKLSYEYYFPTGYNVAADRLCQSRVGMGFTAPCSIVPDENGECELAADYVLEGPDASYAVLTLEVVNAGNKVLSRVTGLEVPLKQGHLTLVKGKFLTTLMDAGIGIDPGYDGDFNIIIK